MSVKLEASCSKPHRPVRVLLGVSGSVATIKLKELLTKLMQIPAEVKIVSTDSARHFFKDDWDLNIPILGDEDDWRSWSKVGDEVMHIQLRQWADILVIAPLSANTLAKLAQGICDNLLTCIVRAWDIKHSALVLAPAMNTYMWDNPFTAEHIKKVTAVYDACFIPPVEKTLACGDIGIGAMAHVDDIVNIVSRQIDCIDFGVREPAL